MAVTDVSNLIERIEAFEEKAGVRLESVGARLDHINEESVYLIVSGELHPQSGTELHQNVELTIAAYDTSSKIVGTVSHRFESEGFFGFEIFEEMVRIPVNNLKRVRILPKRAD